MQTVTTIGMFYQPPVRSDVVVGRTVAIEDFTKALGRHGKNCRYELFCSSRNVERALSIAQGPIRVHDRTVLKDLDRLELAAWHDADFEILRTFLLRARACTPFPVTIGHHTLSYKELLVQAILPLLLARAHAYDAIVCTSHGAHVALTRLIGHVVDRIADAHGMRLSYRGRLEVIPLGVDVERFRPQDRKASRARFNLPHDAFVLLWLGRLSAVDKADLVPLVSSYAALRARRPEVRIELVIAGTEREGERFGGALVEYARSLGVGDSVRVISLPDLFKPQLYSAADVFVSPVDNLQESFGLTPIEAMACGLPQIVSDWNGYRDSVVHGETGFLLPTLWAPCDADVSIHAPWSDSAYDHLTLAQSVAVDMRAFVSGVERLIDEPALREAMAGASRRRAEDFFSYSAVVERYEALWTELAAEARRAPESQRAGVDFAVPNYYGVFGHYATRALPRDALVGLSALGSTLVDGRVKLPTLYLPEWSYLETELLKRILAGCADAKAQGRAIEVDRILHVLSRHPTRPVARDVALRHLLFLVKYGFVEEQGAQATPNAEAKSPTFPVPTAVTPPADPLPPCPPGIDQVVIGLLPQLLGDGRLPVAERLGATLRLLCKHRTQVLALSLVERGGTRVRGGPYAGLNLLPPPGTNGVDDQGGVSEGCYLPKLLGCYEQDLHRVLAALPEASYDAIVNVGCAEGYHAVGIARLCADACSACRVYAYDIDPLARRLCAELAAANGVADRVVIGERMVPEDFARFASARTFVLCDIEGDELDLLMPEQAPALRTMDLLVEVHDEFAPHCGEQIATRFSVSHDIEIIHNGPRDPGAYPEISDLENLDQLLAFWEWRLAGNHWVWLRSRA